MENDSKLKISRKTFHNQRLLHHRFVLEARKLGCFTFSMYFSPPGNGSKFCSRIRYRPAVGEGLHLSDGFSMGKVACASLPHFQLACNKEDPANVVDSRDLLRVFGLSLGWLWLGREAYIAAS